MSDTALIVAITAIVLSVGASVVASVALGLEESSTVSGTTIKSGDTVTIETGGEPRFVFAADGSFLPAKPEEGSDIGAWDKRWNRFYGNRVLLDMNYASETSPFSVNTHSYVGATVEPNAFRIGRSRGAQGSAAACETGDSIMSLIGVGAYDTTSDGATYYPNENHGAIELVAASNFTSNVSVATDMVFGTTKVGDKVWTRYVRLESTGHLRPETTDVYNCGTSTHLWDTVYAKNGLSQTSDERLKDDFKVAPGLDVVRAVDAVSFKWRGEDSERHLGFRAQQLQKALPPDMAVVDDSGEHLAVRYNETIAILWRAVQELSERVDKCSCA